MTIKNRYQKRSHTTPVKFREIIKYFCEGFSATIASNLTRISRNTVNRVYKLLRIRIVEISLLKSPALGEFELDESYFGAKRVRGGNKHC